MEHIITSIENYDNKRAKVTLDYGEVTFLLYKAELRRLNKKPGENISDEAYKKITEEILLPRAKKRVLYYMRNADKTRAQISKKLREGFYPGEVIDKTMEFLDKYGFADDADYADNYIEELRKKSSKREIEAKLYQRGIDRALMEEKLSLITDEDEYTAAERALSGKYPHGVAAEDKNKAYGFLARKGFSYDSIRHAINSAIINS